MAEKKLMSKTNKDIFLMLAGVMLSDALANKAAKEKIKKDELSADEQAELSAVIASLKEMIDKLTPLIAEVTAAEETSEEEVIAKVDSLGKRFDLLANAYTVSTQGASRAQKRETKKTLTDAIKEMDLKAKKGTCVKLADDINVAGIETNPTETTVAPRSPFLGISELFMKSNSGSRSHRIIAATETGSVASVVIRDKKPTLAIEFEQNMVNAETYAGIYRGITDEDLEDFAWLSTFVRARAKQKMYEAINLACYTLLNGSAIAYANAGWAGQISGANLRNAINALVSGLRAQAGAIANTATIGVAVSQTVFDLLENLNNANGTPVMTPLGANVKLIADDNITGTNAIAFIANGCHIANYVTYGEQWGYSVKTLSDESVISEWESDENSLRIRERDLIFVESDEYIMKGDLAAIKTAINAPAAA
jgi:hypothetical protein